MGEEGIWVWGINRGKNTVLIGIARNSSSGGAAMRGMQRRFAKTFPFLQAIICLSATQ